MAFHPEESGFGPVSPRGYITLTYRPAPSLFREAIEAIEKYPLLPDLAALRRDEVKMRSAPGNWIYP